MHSYCGDPAKFNICDRRVGCILVTSGISHQILYLSVHRMHSLYLGHIAKLYIHGKKVINDNHDLTIAGHLEFIQTYTKIARSYYWPDMSADIERHTKECDSCQRTKPSIRIPSGEVQLLQIPARSWQAIGIDYLEPLPESKNSHDVVLVVVVGILGTSNARD